MSAPGNSLLDGLLERLLNQEDAELEFKRAHGGLPRSLWETVSAFANTAGGWIILGVDDSKSPPEVAGVPNASDQLKNFYDSLRNPNKINHPVCGAADASIESIGSRQIILIRVPAAPRKHRPIYINSNPYTGTFVRGFTGDHRCTKPEVDRMMREASDVAADSSVLRHFTLNDLDPNALAKYRRMHQTYNPTSPWNTYDDQHFLQAIGGYGRDRESGTEGVTVAGLLCFGTREAIREWRGRHLIDYRVGSDLSSVDRRWEDRVVWEGNLFDAFQLIYPKLVAELPVPFRLSGARREGEGPLQVALREALVNLLVHADYAETQPSVLIRSPEGYSFRNPGSSRVPEIDLFTLSGDRSDPRNPVLVSMFRYIGWAEEAGTGIARIIAAWRELGLQFPKIDAGTDRYEFSLILRYVHLLSAEDRDWLLRVGEGWSEAEQLALVYARHDGQIDNATLRRLAGLHPADATAILGGLRDKQFLEMVGSGRGAAYRLGPATAAAVASSGSREPGIAVSDLSIKDSESSIEDNQPSLTNVQDKLELIAQPAREKRRLTSADRDALILELCHITPLSITEVATLLSRGKPLVREAVRSLVASGQLQYLYPEQPRHPGQKYWTSTSKKRWARDAN